MIPARRKIRNAQTKRISTVADTVVLRSVTKRVMATGIRA